MGRYITASEAARRLGIADKTVRKWIAQGKLDAHHVHAHQLAILETDVARLARERQLYQKGAPSDQLGKIVNLEQKVSEQEQHIALLEQQVAKLAQSIAVLAENANRQPVPLPSVNASAPAEQPQKRLSVQSSDGLPQGCMLARDFAKMHGVPPETFRDHMLKGLAKDTVSFSERPKAGRPRETERYLTAEQQHSAIDFWRRYGVSFAVCEREECHCTS